MVSTTYYRELTAPGAPEIKTVAATSYQSAQIVLSGDQTNSDSPIAYYLVKNLTTGLTTQVLATSSNTINIQNLLPNTAYSFEIISVNVDGKSQSSTVSKTIGTSTYVPPAPPRNNSQVLNSDATLSALTISSETLTPSFSPNVTSYALTVPNTTTSITESAIVNDRNSTFTINGVAGTSGVNSSSINLSAGANTITTVVTAQDGTSKTYTVTITRTGASDTTISAFTFGGLSPVVTGIVDNTAHTVNLYVPSGTNRSALIPSFSIGIGATMSIGSSQQVSGTTANNFSTSKTYTVLAQDGIATQDYVVTVTVMGALPTISTIGTVSGPRTGGTSVAITGTNFQNGASVTFGGIAAASLTVNSSTSITAVTAARVQGPATIVVTNSDTGSVSRNNGFTFNYIVGDTGLGGGTIFYVDATGFTVSGSACATQCIYLEWAPANWNDPSNPSATDPTLALTSDADHSVNASGTAGVTLGTGFQNTRDLITAYPKNAYAGDISGAAYRANLYAGSDSSAGQWFVPSQNELNLMYQSSIRADGGFQGGRYWSSSFCCGTVAWWQSLGDGTQSGNFNRAGYKVRPIRAFSMTPDFALSRISEQRAVNTQINGFRVSQRSGPNLGYSISPSLPAGVSFNTSTGTLSGTPTSLGTTVFTITATDSYGRTASQNFSLRVVDPVLSCAAGGPCALGDTGPGGGKVFYVSEVGFTMAGATCNTNCHALEWAPVGWSTAPSLAAINVSSANVYSVGTSTADPVVTWSSSGAGTAGATGLTVGTGLSNTLSMLTSKSGYTADTAGSAFFASRYAGGTATIAEDSSAGQWFVPSRDEIIEMLAYATANSSTGFTSWYYFTSSQGYFMMWPGGNFAYPYDYGFVENIRPIRAL